jgi:putative PIN family toxin of toxin-antitoxin system
MTLKVVYDTNVVVSAVLKPGSIPASLVALAMGKRVRLFLAPPILEEDMEVLRRSKFGFDAKAIDAFLRDLKRVAKIIHPTQRITKAPDEPDNRFLE